VSETPQLQVGDWFSFHGHIERASYTDNTRVENGCLVSYHIMEDAIDEIRGVRNGESYRWVRDVK
jgi:hypothetical protein